MSARHEERAQIRERFLRLQAATVSDVLDAIGLAEQGLSGDIQAVSGEVIAGWAYTVVGETASYDGPGDARKMQACHGIGSDEVSVWSGVGAGVCPFGELIAVGMMERGSPGALVDGGLRDVRALGELGFTAFAGYRSVVQSIGRWRVVDVQVPIHVRGACVRHVTVHPGDFVFGDHDGAVVIPADVVEEVLTRAEAMTETENAIRSHLLQGATLGQALERYGHV